MNSRNVTITMQIDKRLDSAETISREIKAELWISKHMDFRDLRDFLQAAGRIFKEAQKIAKAQEKHERTNESYRLEMEALVDRYGEEKYYTWKATDTDGDVNTLKGEESIYFRPELAPEYQDVLLTADIVGSLAGII